MDVVGAAASGLEKFASGAAPWVTGAPVLVLIDATDRYRASLKSLASADDSNCNSCRQLQSYSIRI